jgi:hypothetical protein
MERARTTFAPESIKRLRATALRGSRCGSLFSGCWLLAFVFVVDVAPARANSEYTESAPDPKNSATLVLPFPVAANNSFAKSLDILPPDPDPSANASPNDSLKPQSVQWGPLLKDSFRFLMFEQAFRISQRNTREGYDGPFFRDYFDSVANIHGWRDGDSFTTNYVGHPMQGAISGDIWIANDPRYRDAIFVWSSNQYWKSRLRATAFAAVYSLQFEIGPISEASLGNVQRNPRATGVVDWVITPALGMVWMVGEDAVDAKFISKWEANTHNRAARIMLRGLLNPSRSMSNLMQFKAPWHRDTRHGITQF